jgi:ferric-dicitrate binding protein FerR (iron transport regulator)
MQPKNIHLEVLLERYLQGTASLEEANLIRQWVLELDITDEKLFRDTAEEEQIQSRVWENIYAHIKPEKSAERHYTFPRWLGAVAASLILLLSLTLGYYLYTEKRDTVATSFAYSTDGGAIKSITLPDSTQVTLNLHSKLELLPGYNQRERRVRLVGEAYFDVSKNLKPFIVETGQIETRVLGTAFNIEAYQGEGHTRVSLLRGKVRVQDAETGKQQSDLLPGQMLVYDRLEKSRSVQPIAAQHVTGWISNSIVFNDIPLTDAINRLRQRFGIAIVLEDGVELGGKHVTAQFSNPTAEEALRAILLVHNLHVKQKGGTLYVTP